MSHSHETAGLDDLVKKLRAINAARRAKGLVNVAAQRLSVETSAPPADWKRVSFVRHGEGHHNVAQREWKQAGKPGEPYTLENDSAYRYRDPKLTAVGVKQAEDLRPRAAALSDVELVVVSPMRRAIQTALIGFDGLVARTPVIANELCHEIAGKHTCDQRLPTAQLANEFPDVDFGLIEDEEDPYWGDGRTRETHEHLASRAADFMQWLLDRPEKRIVVATHSTWLMTLFNAVLDVRQGLGDEPDARTWFSTGEMRTVVVGPAGPDPSHPILPLKRPAAASSKGEESPRVRKRPAARR